jgi:SnoaL-like domain
VSAEKVETARAIRDALLSGGPEAAEEFFHPDVTFEVAVGQFEGIEGMSTWFRMIAGYLIDYEIVDTHYIDAGEAVVVNNVMRARGGRTSLATQDQIYLLVFQGSKVIRVSRHATADEAVALAGQSEPPSS